MDFYTGLRDIREYHRADPTQPAEMIGSEFTRVNREKESEELERMFSGEEWFGKYLDLHALHDLYNNLKDVKHLDYVAFIDKIDKFNRVPKATRLTHEYKRYLDECVNYLESFMRRAQPLLDINLVIGNDLQEEFDKSWNEGALPGWQDVLEMNGQNGNSSEDLYCEACDRLFAKSTVFEAHFKAKKHIKAAEALKKKQAGSTSDKKNVEEARQEKIAEKHAKFREIAYAEFLIGKYLEVLTEQRQATKSSVERKQTLTLEELTTLAEEEQVVAEQDEPEDQEYDDRIYNPLKLPLGWDGKPIPFWLYKLHGLDKEFPCEICGNFVYMGRKAFNRHFQEWRHAQGMRSLGIPNTTAFQEITKIRDAYALWDKIQQEKQQSEFQAETMEEFEDAQGHVFSKKTYEDLKRQGLL